MNGKQRMLAALQGGAADRLPVAPIYLHLYLAAEMRLHALESYLALMGDRVEMPLDPETEVDVRARAYLAAWWGLGETPDWIWTRLLPTVDWLAGCTLRKEGAKLWRIHHRDGEREDLSLLTPANGLRVRRRLPGFLGRAAQPLLRLRPVAGSGPHHRPGL